MAVGPAAAAELMNGLAELVRRVRTLAQHNRDLGASGTTLGVLKGLRHSDTRPSDLAVALHVGPSVISRALVPLEEEGLVERKVDPVDGRATLLGLTELGRARLGEISRANVEQLSRALVDWTDDEAFEAARLLSRLQSALAGLTPPHGLQADDALHPEPVSGTSVPPDGPPTAAATDASAAPPRRPPPPEPLDLHHARASRRGNV